MKYEINVLNVPNQSFSFNLADEDGNLYALDMKLRTLPDRNMIADIYLNGEMVITSAMCCDRMPMMPTNVLNGNIYFEDVFGKSDPVYEGLGEQYKLIYDTEFRLG